MTYVVVIKKHQVIGIPFDSYDEAFTAAIHEYGDNITDWISLNLRVEECRRIEGERVW